MKNPLTVESMGKGQIVRGNIQVKGRVAGVIVAKKVSLTNKEKRAEFGSTLKDFFFLYKYFFASTKSFILILVLH